MKTTEIVLDIETARDLREPIHAKLRSCIEPDGRLKDPEKIAADLAKKEADIVAKAGLDPLTGRIVCVGVGVRNGGGRVITRDVYNSIADHCENGWSYKVELARTRDDEAWLLSCLADILQAVDTPTLITWNGRRFDLPFIAARAALHGVRFPWRLPLGYARDLHVDLCDVFDRGLDLWSTPILGEGKPLDGGGAAVQALVDAGEWGVLRDYNLDDLRKTAALWERVRGVVRS